MWPQNQPKTIPELFFNRTKATPEKKAVMYKSGGSWKSMSWQRLDQETRALAKGLSEWIQPNEMACILSENRPEWWMADIATMSLGGVTAPIYTTNSPGEIAYIINDCDATLIFVSNQAHLATIKKLVKEKKTPKLKRIVVFEEVNEKADWIYSLSQVKNRNGVTEDTVDKRLKNIKPEDLATLIYTSGTTGEPKGVMLTHHNLVSNAMAANELVRQLDLDERLMLSFLPLSHSFERMAGYYVAIHYGFTVAFAESVEKLVDNMGEVKPTMLISVPRIYEKLYAKVMEATKAGIDPDKLNFASLADGFSKMVGGNGHLSPMMLFSLPKVYKDILTKVRETTQGELKKQLLNWSLGVGKEHANYRLSHRCPPKPLDIKYHLATKLVFSKLHERLGGRLRYAVSGGAPLAPEIADFLNAIGLMVFEGYGLSETSPVITSNMPNAMRVGSVGKVWPGIEVKIQPEPGYERDGEILARGPSVMKGYYKKDAATSEVIDAEKWFHTGDIGYVDSEGFLFITDRKKELIKTSGGKYVAPQPIENQLKLNPYVEQVVMIGDRRKFCVALIVPNFETLAQTLGRDLPADLTQLNDDPEVLGLFQEAVDEVNQGLGRWEQIKRFYILPQEMTQDTGELTPTLKVKRRVVCEKYKSVIDTLYPAE